MVCHLTPHLFRENTVVNSLFSTYNQGILLFFLWPLLPPFTLYFNTCLSKYVTCIQRTPRKTGNLHIGQRWTDPPSCLSHSGLQSACQLVCLSHCIFVNVSLYTIPTCLSVNKTANITTGYSRNYARFVTLFQFLCPNSLFPVYHIQRLCRSSKLVERRIYPGKKSPVLSCVIKVVTATTVPQHRQRIKTKQDSSSLRVTDVWPKVSEQSLAL